MKNIDSTVIKTLLFDPEEIQERQAFLHITPADGARLRHHRRRLMNLSGGFINEFYNHLLSFPALRKLLPSSERVRRLQKTQFRYWLRLLSGRYDANYVADRLRIGVTHERVGLDLKWYTGAYSLFLSHLLTSLCDEKHITPGERRALMQSLIRLVFFDMGLAIDTYVRADQHRLAALKTYAERIIQTVPCAVAVTTADLRILTANPKLEEIFATPRDTLCNQSLENFLPLPGLSRLVLDLLEGDQPHALNFEQQAENGEQLFYHIEIAPIQLDDILHGDSERGLVFTIEDFTEHEYLKLQSARSRARLDTVMNSVPDGILTFHADGSLEAWNPAVERLFGYNAREMEKLNLSKLLTKERYRPWFVHQLLSHLWRPGAEPLSAFGLSKDGLAVPLEITVSPILKTDPPLYLAVLRDVSRQKQAEDELMRMAHFDLLTELPNRALFLDRLVCELAASRRHQTLLAVLFLDLDDFKKVNDGLGHLAGDRLLQEVARRLKSQLRETDTLARFGGDEFTIILTDLHAPDDYLSTVEKILEIFTLPFHLETQEVFVRASIGVALSPLHGVDPQTLLKHADAAMYQAKYRGHGHYYCYHANLGRAAARKISLESELHRALERNELSLAYQPQVCPKSGAIFGVEALLRWRNTTLGQVAPDRFIPYLEHSGLIHPVGEWCLATALAQADRWRKSCGFPLQMAVNISACQIAQADFPERISRLLEETGFPPQGLELEITENVLMERDDCTLGNLETLRAMGMRLAIDDFGIGYSSLGYLRSFPFDTLKMDRSFIQHLDTVRDIALARHIVGIGHSLELTVIAEGVENASQLTVIQDLGCDRVQGYYFYRPLSSEELTRLLHTQEKQ
ncbi:EAL domain-containing protein [Methylohalobius crimeensis]|uniref:EAL domain-containing protein n=1 Tax=Methylohalobius crimeensis TaxID=244365 RepID=UPI0003B7173B|nr:EAL domain-containing protein [Methylohalobius crimeensis]